MHLSSRKARWPNPHLVKKKEEGTTPARTTTQTISKKDRCRYEVIFEWLTTRQPFGVQKLAFDSDRSFKNAYNEAVAIRRLLISAGDFKASDVKILSVSVAGALEKYQKESITYFRKSQKELKEAVKNIRKLGLKKGSLTKKVLSPSKHTGPIVTR